MSESETPKQKSLNGSAQIEGDGNIVGDENVVQLHKTKNGGEIHDVTQVAGDEIQGDKVDHKKSDKRSGGVYFKQTDSVTINGDVVGGDQTKTEC